MLLNILKSKIHRVTVTEANLEYIGSITIDEALMEAANIYAGEGHAIDIFDADVRKRLCAASNGSGCRLRRQRGDNHRHILAQQRA